MKRFYVSVVTFLFVSIIGVQSGWIFPNAWAPAPTGNTVEVEQEPQKVEAIGSQVQNGTVTINREIIQSIDRGQLLYNNQLYQATQIGNTIYLPDAQRAYTIPNGYVPITLGGHTILFNQTTGNAINLDWGQGYNATMPSTLLPDDGVHLPDDGVHLPDDGVHLPDDGVH